jgi:hypothetical protein
MAGPEQVSIELQRPLLFAGFRPQTYRVLVACITGDCPASAGLSLSLPSSGAGPWCYLWCFVANMERRPANTSSGCKIIPVHKHQVPLTFLTRTSVGDLFPGLQRPSISSRLQHVLIFPVFHLMWPSANIAPMPIPSTAARVRAVIKERAETIATPASRPLRL